LSITEEEKTRTGYLQTTLYIEQIVGQCRTKKWTYSDKSKTWLEQVGIHRVQICVKTGDLESDLELNFNERIGGGIRRRLRNWLGINPTDSILGSTIESGFGFI